MRISDWSSDVCYSDLDAVDIVHLQHRLPWVTLTALPEQPVDRPRRLRRILAVDDEVVPVEVGRLGRNAVLAQIVGRGIDPRADPLQRPLAEVRLARRRDADELGRASCRERGGREG